MNPFLAVILVCANAVAREDCTRDTALDIATRPAPNPMVCLMAGQEVLAREGMLGEGRYPVVRCERRHG